MKAIRWVLLNGGFALCIYYGLFLGNEGAENIAIFYIWVTVFFSMFLLSDDFIKKITEKKQTPSVPRWLDATFDVCVLMVLLYAGWMIAGIFYFIHFLILQGVYEKIYGNNKDRKLFPETDHY